MNKQLSLFDRESDYLETSVNDYDSHAASFRVHASLIYKLGESLIADEVTALSELIKNSYDADATICKLTIDSEISEEINGRTCTGLIEIFDNGCGMNLSTIVNGWLTLSNSPKKKMKKEHKTTPKFHRYPLGDKGLGRLSVQKLGRYMQMITKAADSNTEYSVVIPWGDFLKNTTIDQIPVSISEKEVSSDKSYTKIVIRDLVDPELWAKPEQINLLSNSINKIVSPFRSKETGFRIIAQINGQPVDIDNRAFDELLLAARAKHSIRYDSGIARITSEYKPAFFYNRDVLTKVKAGDFTLSETAIKDFINTCRNEVPGISIPLESGISLVSEDMCTNPSIIPPINTMPNQARKDVPSYDPGSFECEIFEYSLENAFLDYMYTNVAYSSLIRRDEFRDFVARFHGIKVVRDGFVIQGLGEGDGGDWLGLTSSSKTTGKYFDLRNESVIGCVYLTGINNYSLKETTNREGFVDDEYFESFRGILNQSIKRINRNRNKLNELMKQYVANSLILSGNTSDEILNYKPAIEQIKEDLGKVDAALSQKDESFAAAINEYHQVREMMEDSNHLSREEKESLNELYGLIKAAYGDYRILIDERDAISKKVDAITLDFEKMSERIKDLLELAGLGLSAEMFSHEFDSTISNVRLKNQSIISDRANQTVESMSRHINYVTYSLDALRKQMSYFNPGLKFVRAEKQVFSFEEFVNTHRSFYEERCKNKQISFITNVYMDFQLRLNRGMFNQVFDNLFSNSEYWLDYSIKNKLIDDKQYHIASPERGIILVWDNGIGISPDIETRLFEPFETKKENGRGLGLYIAAGNLKYSSSRIRLLNERNQFGNLFKFEIDVSQVMQ